MMLSAITYIDRVCISVAGPRMQEALDIDPVVSHQGSTTSEVDFERCPSGDRANTRITRPIDVTAAGMEVLAVIGIVAPWSTVTARIGNMGGYVLAAQFPQRVTVGMPRVDRRAHATALRRVEAGEGYACTLGRLEDGPAGCHARLPSCSADASGSRKCR